MPISDRYHTVATRARLLAIAPLTCLLLTQPLAAQKTSALAQAELQRRASNARQAQEFLKKGDEAYEAGKWADAVSAYTSARDLLPEAPATAATRTAATERLVQASIEQARNQKRLGDVAGANETMNKVLAEGVAPDSGLALEMQEQINDPIRTNPAGTLEHAKDTEEVRLLLYKADGFKNLGDFNKAEMVYEDVLRVDPYNKAARRGMEQVVQNKADYYRAAYDEARADMLGEVDESWQLRVRPQQDIDAALRGDMQAPGARTTLLTEKMDRIILPVISFDQVKIQEAFDFLRAQSIDRDTIETDPARKGVNFVLQLGDSAESKAALDATISLDLRNVPLSQVVKYISEQTRTIADTQSWAVVIRPAGGGTTELLTRSFRVPPDFLSSAGSAAGGGGELDPFATDKPASEGILAKRMDAIEVLKGYGVSFPEGASATFNATTSSLRVTNTHQNLAMVEEAVAQVGAAEPRMVSVQVRLIKIQQRNLEELGFDWLLDDYSLGGTGLTPGTTAGHLSGGTQNPENLADMPLAPGSIFQNAITSGNRSGNEAISGNSIDDRILEQQQGFSTGSSRAPGIAWMNGIVNNTNLTMMMRGFSQSKGVDIVISPSTVTRSGQQSTVEVIREFIYPTEYEPPELPNSVGGGDDVFVDLDTGEVIGGGTQLVPITPATPTSFEMEKVGVVLDVLPTVSGDGHYVDVAVKPSITDFDGFVNYGSPITGQAPTNAASLSLSNEPVVITKNEILMPVFSRTSLDSHITMEDGATFAIGGLMDERIQKVEDHTKILGDIPVVGRLFRSEAYSPTRSMLLFLVTVKVVDPTGENVRDR